MIVIGARFRALSGARAALRAVLASVAVAPGDASVRPLGSTRYETVIDDFVVAGRFEDEDAQTVVQLFHAHGGAIIERRPDSPRGQAHAPAQAQRSSRLAMRPAQRSGGTPRKRLRRPSPPLRVRTARRHRIEH